jgi:hypothetical protein
MSFNISSLRLRWDIHCRFAVSYEGVGKNDQQRDDRTSNNPACFDTHGVRPPDEKYTRSRFQVSVMRPRDGSFPFLQPDLDEPADSLGAAGLIVLTGGPSVNLGEKLIRETDSPHRIAACGRTASLIEFW